MRDMSFILTVVSQHYQTKQTQNVDIRHAAGNMDDMVDGHRRPVSTSTPPVLPNTFLCTTADPGGIARTVGQPHLRLLTLRRLADHQLGVAPAVLPTSHRILLLVCAHCSPRHPQAGTTRVHCRPGCPGLVGFRGRYRRFGGDWTHGARVREG